MKSGDQLSWKGGHGPRMGQEEIEVKPTVWVGNDSMARALVGDLKLISEIAIDTEFHRERTYYPRLALVQLCWSSGSALLDPLSIDMTLLRPLFEAETLFVFHAFEQDLEILERSVGCRPLRVFDTQIAAGFVGFSRPSLSTLAEKFLSLTLPKADRLSDWTKRPLSEAQLEYAVSDVRHLLELRRRLQEELAKLARTGWVEDEIAESAKKRRLSVSPEDAWLKIKECRGLKGDARKVAWALAAWREQRARDRDIPPRYLLSDLGVAAISQFQPLDIDALGSVRSVEIKKLGPGVIEEILEAIRIGLATEHLPEQPSVAEDPTRGTNPLLGLAQAWLGAKAQQEKLDAQLLGTREDVVDFLLRGREGRLSHGWRKKLVGDDLEAIAAGRAGLFVASDGLINLRESGAS